MSQVDEHLVSENGNTYVPPCTGYGDIFFHAGMAKDEQKLRGYPAHRNTASRIFCDNLCQTCEMFDQCLADAVLNDPWSYRASSMPRTRLQMRRDMGLGNYTMNMVKLNPERSDDDSSVVP